MTALLKIGLVSVSDRASQGVYPDQGIPELKNWLEQALVDPFEVVERLIPDEQPEIERTLCELVDEAHCHLMLRRMQHLLSPIVKCRGSVNKCVKLACILYRPLSFPVK